MKKTDLLIGLFIGLIVAFIGAYLFLKTQTKFDLIKDFYEILNQRLLGKIIALGSVLNLILFFILLKLKKEIIARGVVMATIILALSTLFL